MAAPSRPREASGTFVTGCRGEATAGHVAGAGRCLAGTCSCSQGGGCQRWFWLWELLWALSPAVSPPLSPPAFLLPAGPAPCAPPSQK